MQVEQNLLLAAKVDKSMYEEFKLYCGKRSQPVSSILRDLIYKFLLEERKANKEETNGTSAANTN